MNSLISFLTPQFFDALVIVVIIFGLFLAARRIRNDFRKGPRFPDEPPVLTPIEDTQQEGRAKQL